MARDEATHSTQDEAPAEGGRPAALKSMIASLLTVAIVGAIGVGLYRGLNPLEERAVSILGARAPRVAVEWPSLASTTETKSARPGILDTALLSVSSASLPDAPTWLPRQMQEDIVALAQRNLDPAASPLSVDPLTQVGIAMERSGWFDGRPMVRREPGGLVTITGQWRIPSAVIRRDGKDHLISWDGKPMPVVWEEGQAQLPVLTGVAHAAPSTGSAPEYTGAWPGEDVQAGLELLRLIRSKPWLKQVASIDVTNFEKERTLSLKTVAGGQINFGGRPNKPRLGEASTPAKIATIESILRKTGSIDNGGRVYDVWWQGQALEIDVSASAGSDGQPAPAKQYPTSPLPPE